MGKKRHSHFDPGQYRALEWDEAQNGYAVNENLGIQVDVEVRWLSTFLKTLTIIL